jgi:hypothetical protein
MSSPSQIASGDQPGAHRVEETRRDELEPAERRKLAFSIRPVFLVQQIGTVVSVRGNGVRKRGRGDAWDRGNSSLDLLEHPDNALGLLHMALGNKNAQRLQTGGVESGLDMPQCLKCPDHQAGTDEQNQRQGCLQHHEAIPRLVSLFALTQRSSTGAKCRGHTLL